MVEMVLIVPVLLLMLLMTHRIYRSYKIACNAAVVVRTEIMHHSYRHAAGISDSPDYNDHEAAFIAAGVLPGESEATVEISPYYILGNFGKFMGSIAGAFGLKSDKIQVEVTLLKDEKLIASMFKMDDDINRAEGKSTLNTSAAGSFAVRGTCAVVTHSSFSWSGLKGFLKDTFTGTDEDPGF